MEDKMNTRYKKKRHNEIYGDKSFIIGAFRSRQHVLGFIRDLNARGGDARVINTPHEILIGCGLSAAFDLKYYELGKNIIRELNPVSFVGFYKGTPNGVRLKVTPAMKYSI